MNGKRGFINTTLNSWDNAPNDNDDDGDNDDKDELEEATQSEPQLSFTIIRY